MRLFNHFIYFLGFWFDFCTFFYLFFFIVGSGCPFRWSRRIVSSVWGGAGGHSTVCFCCVRPVWSCGRGAPLERGLEFEINLELCRIFSLYRRSELRRIDISDAPKFLSKTAIFSFGWTSFRWTKTLTKIVTFN